MAAQSDPMTTERQRRLRSRNWAVFFALIAFVVIVYAVTIIKIKLSHGL